ncbi:MAG: DUF3500 domain-containing protein [Verrucomicrobia bacterium]|jgi:hypothetical protein|nr:DUF3500 domain-containing protein [Verrucomicrobiota bacterium]|tara:strand:- start:14192 stop:15217 length:1026 start_codon:yes stop_codon:yes gene_type:complete
MKRLLLLGLFASSSLFAKEPVKTTADLQPVAADMATAANALIASLDEAQVKKARFPFKSDERENWGFVPRKRNGLPLKELDDKQISLVRALLKTTLSDPGLKKVDTIMALEAFLGEIEKRPDFRNPKAYFTSIFGDPSATGTWGWRYEGHHLALNYTIANGKAVAVTPSFFASNPGEITIEHKMKGTRPLAAEEDLARALATTLKESGKDPVYSEKPPGEILTGSDRKAKQLDPVGIKASEMTETQQAALKELIAEYANRHRKELAEADIAKITADLDNLSFAWAGSLKRGEAYYYRIQGTTFLVEVANVQNDGNHVHAVWRDRTNDFGRDLLGDHVGHDH